MTTAPGSIDYLALLRRAHATIEEMEARLARAERARHEPIAIVGMGLRFPGGAVDAAGFWKLLHDGVDVVTEVPRDRWDADAFFDTDPDAPGKSYTRWGAFLDGIDRFDPTFFGISPREAAAMDPQHRLLLEVAWEALEDAGHAGPALAGSRTGVFVGMAGSDFAVLPRGDLRLADTYFATGAARSIAAGRISYTLGLQGPSVSIDTACSSSAVATHLACQSLRAGDADLALAGGVNVMLAPDGSISTSRGRMMSFSGRCRTFDAAADGYVRAEGCALLVLRRLSDAVADGDNVLAVILGTAVNQDGRSNGLTAPSAQAQESVIRAALADAGVAPAEVGAIEAHGTGTTLGDPIEMRAISAVFATGRSPGTPLLVGSVKTNIGHTEGVAGTAGLVKLILALRNRTLPPHLHLRDPNPMIPWATLPVAVPTAPTAWEVADGGRRIAGVSSFGFSGTNSHIVVAEAPAATSHCAASRAAQVVTISAKTPAALEQLAGRYERHLAEHPELELADVAFTAGTGRTHFAERIAVIAESGSQVSEALGAWRAGHAVDGLVRATADTGAIPDVAFLFTGQGSQFVGMAGDLWETEPVFRAALQRCDDLLRPHLERPLLSVLFPNPEERADADRLIDQTAFTQPALFAVEWALAQQWLDWGVQPALVMGHSIGEYVAACVAGVFSLEDGLRLVAARARLMQALPDGGAMAAVFADEPTVAAAVAAHAAAGSVSIAAANGPRNTVVSGQGDAVREILAELAEQGVQSKALRVSHAFHSPLMDPMLTEFASVAKSLAYSVPQIGLVSNVSGTIAGPEIATADYWVRHVRAPVRFADGVRTLRAEGCSAFLEVGPGSTLLGMAQAVAEPEVQEIGSHTHSALRAPQLLLPSLRRDHDGTWQMLHSAATLHVHGVELDWARVAGGEGRLRVPLPTHPFQRQRHWMEFPAPGQAPARPKLHPLVHERVRSPMIAGAAFQSRIAADAPAYLDDHRIFDVPLFPATGLLEMAAAVGRITTGGAVVVDELEIREALPLPDGAEALVQVACSTPADGESSFQIFSLEDEAGDRWKLHAEGRFTVAPSVAADDRNHATSLDTLRARITAEFPADEFYARLEALGVRYGPAFRGLREIRRRDGEALARVALPDGMKGSAAEHVLHPALLDACVQLLGAAVPGAEIDRDDAPVYVPVEIGGFRVERPGVAAAWCHAELHGGGAETGEVLSGSLVLFDDRGARLAGVESVRLRRAPRAAIERTRRGVGGDTDLDWLYELHWERSDTPPAADEWARGRWLILADNGGFAARVASRIFDGGGTCDVLAHDELSAAGAEFPAELLRGTGGDGGALRGIVHLGGLDAPSARTAAAMLDHQRRVCGSAVALTRALAEERLDNVGLWLVTRGSQAVDGTGTEVRPEQAPLWGLGGSIALEHPAIRCVRVDLDPGPGADPAAEIATDLAATDGEDQIAWRRGHRYGARLRRYAGAADGAGAPQEAVELAIGERGILDDLEIRPADRRVPGPGEVEVEVRASGLNFRDVLNALGMYPGNAGPLGSECAGVVSAVGEGVARFAVGDEVIALAAGTFRSHVVASAVSVYPKPPHLGFREAAGIPLVFLTAYHGLRELAGIGAGDRVLIHAAAGGVGLAAVRLALRAGAEVFCTAGNEAKREFLRSVGVHHVMDSRSLDFADRVREVTGGAGVDVVLNALSDEFIPASLSVLSDGGCFLEIGKRGIWSDEQVRARFPTVRYHVYDLADVMRRDTGWMAATLDRLMPDFESGTLQALPLHEFPLRRAADAFRFMAQAKHTGKIVLTQAPPGMSATAPIRGDATYLVTGGLGGLGLAVGRWLVDRGARSLVLVGRSEPGEPARTAIAEMETAGAHVVAMRADIGDTADVARVLAAIEGSMPPLKGVVHAAGVVDDAMLVNHQWERFETVMRAKLLGTWHLHEQTLRLPLDFFLLFSAGSTLLGSTGQSNYVAANAFLDAMAHFRRGLGLPATAIGWGAWADVGMAAALDAGARERWREAGIGMISPADGMRVVDRVLRDRPVHVAATQIDWSRFLPQLGAAGESPFFSAVRAASADRAEPRAADAPSLLLQTLDAAEPERRRDLLLRHVEERVRHVLALDESVAIGPRAGFSDLGMDSLMAVELSNHLASAVGRKLPSTVAFEHPTLDLLTDYLAFEVLALSRSEPPVPDSARGEPPAGPDAARVADVAALSEEETEDTLLKELERAGY